MKKVFCCSLFVLATMLILPLSVMNKPDNAAAIPTSVSADISADDSYTADTSEFRTAKP